MTGARTMNPRQKLLSIVGWTGASSTAKTLAPRLQFLLAHAHSAENLALRSALLQISLGTKAGRWPLPEVFAGQAQINSHTMVICI